jgi:hypothetical protein
MKPSFMIGEGTRNVYISNLNHLRGDGVYRRSNRVADRYSGPGSSFGHAGSRVRIHGRDQHEGLWAPSGGDSHCRFVGECAGDQFQRRRFK